MRLHVMANERLHFRVRLVSIENWWKIETPFIHNFLIKRLFEQGQVNLEMSMIFKKWHGFSWEIFSIYFLISQMK